MNRKKIIRIELRQNVNNKPYMCGMLMVENELSMVQSFLEVQH